MFCFDYLIAKAFHVLDEIPQSLYNYHPIPRQALLSDKAMTTNIPSYSLRPFLDVENKTSMYR
jgi:hypothetical protein